MPRITACGLHPGYNTVTKTSKSRSDEPADPPLFEPPKGRFKRVAFSLVASSEVEAPRSDLTPAAKPPFDKPVLSNVEGLRANGG
jgi:hypothetical protein